jgi:hypothetical protein
MWVTSHLITYEYSINGPTTLSRYKRDKLDYRFDNNMNLLKLSVVRGQIQSLLLQIRGTNNSDRN